MYNVYCTLIIEERDHLKEINCGLIMPISDIGEYTEQHWLDVKEMIINSLRESTKYKFNIGIVSDQKGSSIIHNSIVQGLYDSEIIICDISALNSNVMFELGMRLAFDRPVIIIKDNLTVAPFDINSIKYEQYSSDLHFKKVNDFSLKLLNVVEETLLQSEEGSLKSFLSTFSGIRVSNLEKESITESEALEQIYGVLNLLTNKVDKLSVNYPMLKVDRDLIKSVLDNQVVNSLTDIEENIIRLRYGVDDGVNRSVDIVAKVFGVSTLAIFETEQNGLKKIFENI